MNTLLRTLLVLLLVTSTSTLAGLDEGGAAYNRGDYATAVKEFRLLAEQGDAIAQHSLGVMYRNGQGVPQDYTEAVRWYRMAADQGDSDAQYNLGLMYRNGQGVPQDYTEAVRWYRMAADQGNASAQVSLGVMYATGRSVPQDYVEAHKWYDLAASTGHPTAAQIRQAVASKMTHAQIAEAQKLAREWRPK